MLADDIREVERYVMEVCGEDGSNCWNRIKAVLNKVESATHNTGSKFVAQMPPDCSECPIFDKCYQHTYNQITCHATLWRHFVHA